MVKLTQEGAYVIGGSVIVEEAKPFDADQVGGQCREIGLPPVSE